MPPPIKYSAFGLTLSPEDWVKHSFCRVSVKELLHRIIDLQWSPAKAITEPPANPGKTRFRGVSFHKNNKKWVAQIKIDGKVHFIGNYENDVDAAKAFDRVAGPLGRETNFDA
jgi:hypothetical protein